MCNVKKLGDFCGTYLYTWMGNVVCMACATTDQLQQGVSVEGHGRGVRLLRCRHEMGFGN